MGSELTPEVLAKMRERAAYWGPPSREQCIGEDHMARDVLELLDEIGLLREDNAKLRDMVNAEGESSQKLRLYFQRGLAVGRRGPRCDMGGDSAGKVIPT